MRTYEVLRTNTNYSEPTRTDKSSQKFAVDNNVRISSRESSQEFAVNENVRTSSREVGTTVYLIEKTRIYTDDMPINADITQNSSNQRESVSNQRESAFNQRESAFNPRESAVILGIIILDDEIRKESFEAIKKLHKMGIKIAMITGDKKEVAEKVAKELGIDEYFAEVLPEEKVNKVRELQKRNLKVMMVGDGINDAPALMQADVGVAIGAGTNVAIESAGIILVRSDPRDIVKLIELSRKTYRKMIENLFWATGYNVITIPLAAGILAFKGIFLSPALAAVLMSLSTIIVAFNALRLKD